MEIDKLDYIMAVAEERNITKAAAKLYISQPTLTKYITRLEEELGVVLFDRNSTPIRLTEAGSVYIRRMVKIRKEQEYMRQELLRIGDESKSFHMGIGPSRARLWIPKIFPELYKQYPNMKFSEFNGNDKELEQMLLNGSIDAAVGGFREKQSGLCYKKIAEEGIYLAIPPMWVADYDMQADSLGVLYIDESVLEGHRVIISSSHTSLYQNVKKLFQRHDKELENYCMVMGDAGVALQLALDGQVGAFVMRNEDGTCTMQEPELGNLVICALWGETFRRDLYFAWREDSDPGKIQMIEAAWNEISKNVFHKEG